MLEGNAGPSQHDIDLIPEIQRQFSLLEDRFSRLKTEVRQAMQLSALGSATAVWAHELNNLVTPLLSYAQYALGDGDPELMKKSLRITVANAKTIIAMSDRILGLSAQNSAPTPEEVNLGSAVEHAITCLGRNLDKDGITLKVDVPDDLEAWVDPHCLRQVLFNLILNARDAMAKVHGGRLSIRAARDGRDHVLIRMNDTGGGISPDQLDGVFEPFATTKRSTRNGHVRCGGVGLPLSRQILEECGGRIDVASEPGIGATFTIVLPAKAPPE